MCRARSIHPRLPLSHPLPAGPRDLCRGRASPRTEGGWPLGRLPFLVVSTHERFGGGRAQRGAGEGASYADVRLDEHVTQDIIVKNGQLAAVSDDASEGFGVRVIVDGAWGFAGSARLDMAEVEPVVDRAIRIARASARVRSMVVDLGPPVTSRGRYRTPLERDPFSVPLSEKVDLLLLADAAMGSVKGVTIREGSMEFIRQAKLFASTEGAFTEQELFESGAGIEATATSPDEVQNRSYPNSFGRHQGAGGYEYISALQLDRHGERIGEEAVN